MTRHDDLFYNINTSTTSTISWDDYYQFNCSIKGVLLILTQCNCVANIYGNYYVHNIKHNLLSAVELIANDFDVIFCDTSCKYLIYQKYY